MSSASVTWGPSLLPGIVQENFSDFLSLKSPRMFLLLEKKIKAPLWDALQRSLSPAGVC